MTKQEWNNEHNIWRNRPTLMPGVRTYARTLLSCLDLSDSECVCSLMFRFLLKQVKLLLICCVTQRKLCQLSRWITQYLSICLLSLDASLDFPFVSLPFPPLLSVFACLCLLISYHCLPVCLCLSACYHCLSVPLSVINFFLTILTCSAPTVLIGLHLYKLLMYLGIKELQEETNEYSRLWKLLLNYL